MQTTQRLIARILALGVLLGAVLVPAGALAAGGVELSTAYPAVAVEPGESSTFDLKVTAPKRQQVDLAVSDAPEGWTTTLRGGGFVIDGVFADPKSAPEVQLEVSVPPDVQPGKFQVKVTAKSSSGSDTLTLDLRVAESVPGGVTLSTDFGQLQGSADETFNFDVQLANNSPRETTFNLETAGPEGWQIDARPAGQQQAAAAKVAPGATETITVTADPPDNAVAGSYQIGMRATGGGQQAELALQVDITGNFVMTFGTRDQRLNAEATAGGSGDLVLIVQNDGTAPLTGLSFSASPPQDWEVTFRPEAIDAIAPGQNATVTATIKPSADAVAGDYQLNLTATAAETSESLDIRTTVKTSAAWGIVGILLIVAAVAGLGYVFRRYGRR